MAEEETRITGFVAKFSHKTHIGGGAECVTCHQGIEEKEKPAEGYHIPVGSICTDCHGTSDYVEYKEQCITCHGGEFTFKPANHTVYWNKDHGISWQMETNSCDHCHSKMYCVNCHQGDNLDREIHSLNYRTTHGIDARANKENCVTCHQELSFCNDCHSIEMVMPRNHSYVGWSSGPGGGLHAREAQYEPFTRLGLIGQQLAQIQPGAFPTQTVGYQQPQAPASPLQTVLGVGTGLAGLAGSMKGIFG